MVNIGDVPELFRLEAPNKTQNRIRSQKQDVYTIYFMGPRLQDWTVFRDDKGKVVTGKNRYYTTEH